jgi:hypothetical protein
LKNLSHQYKLSTWTIRRKLDWIKPNIPTNLIGKCVIAMDTCYFGRGFGVMVFRNTLTHVNHKWQYVNHETVQKYIDGFDNLKREGWNIQGIVCDGKRVLSNAFEGVPVQMCQFHQVAIITRYITRNPKLEAGKDLKSIVQKLCHSNQDDFQRMLDTWENKWEVFLKEKTYSIDNGKWHFTHRRLRSAIRSLKTNFSNLFSYKKYPDRNIPNTTNSMEGTFSRLKIRLRIHSGIKQWRKIKMIDEILSK